MDWFFCSASALVPLLPGFAFWDDEPAVGCGSWSELVSFAELLVLVVEDFALLEAGSEAEDAELSLPFVFALPPNLSRAETIGVQQKRMSKLDDSVLYSFVYSIETNCTNGCGLDRKQLLHYECAVVVVRLLAFVVCFCFEAAQQSPVAF